jgi:hypothetical protein
MADTGWKRLHFHNQTSSWTMVNTGTFDNGTAEHLLIYIYTNGSTNQASPFMRFNGSGENDSYGNGKYSYRSNSDMHTSDVGADAQNWIDLKGDQYGGWTMYKIHIIAKKGYDKLIWWNATRVHGNTGGDDVSGVAQWVNTTENITSIQIKEEQGDTMNAGLNILVLGSDDGTATIATKDKSSITNVPVGTRYEETDTRKIFRRAITTATHTQSVSNTLTGIDLNQPTGGGGWGIKIVTGHTLVGKKMNSITFNMRIVNIQNYATQTITLKHFGSAPATIRATGSTMSTDDVATSSTDYTFTFANPVTIQADDFILMTVPDDIGTAGGWNATISDSGEESGSYIATWTENSSSFDIQTGQSRKMKYSTGYQSGEAWVEKGTA